LKRVAENGVEHGGATHRKQQEAQKDQ
jgi:hypothetical protein